MHLDEVKMIDNDEKAQPVHVVLGASEYARIKTKSEQKVGLPGEPVAEYFVQKCPQNAGNAVSETQISKNFRVGMPPDRPTIVSSLWPPPH